ncbi:MAG: EipB family protein, partial [Methyloligellaceae bacterium]
AQSGQRILQANIYDGSDQGKKYFATTSVVGNRVAPGTGKPQTPVKAARILDELASWPVSISYYESGDGKDDGVPTYQMAFRFFENGVTRDLKIDYGKFSVNGKLADIEFYDPADCQ